MLRPHVLEKLFILFSPLIITWSEATHCLLSFRIAVQKPNVILNLYLLIVFSFLPRTFQNNLFYIYQWCVIVELFYHLLC